MQIKELELDLENLLWARENIEQEYNDIRLRIDLAKAEAKKNKEYVDPIVFSEWKKNLADKTQELHRANRQIKDIRRKINSSGAGYTHALKEAVKEIYGDAGLRQVLDLASSTYNQQAETTNV